MPNGFSYIICADVIANKLFSTDKAISPNLNLLEQVASYVGE